ncbi:MAG: GGDEF domain-containing protein [Gammaproteobacteria bacterium]
MAPVYPVVSEPSAPLEGALDPGLQDRLRHCQALPSLSTVALRVIELANDPGAEFGEVAGCISHDPALATKVLRVANSPLYGNRRKATTVRQALTQLGLDNTVCLALGFSLISSLEGAEQGFLDRPRFWQRSLVCAVAARVLGSVLEVERLEELFLGALLQDIGVLILDSVMEAGYGALANGTDHEDLPQAERELLGTDHIEVGVWMIDQWGLPGYLSDLVRGSHDPSSPVPEDLATMAHCVCASSAVADCWLRSAGDRSAIQAADCCRRCLDMEPDAFQQVMDLFPAELQARAALLNIPSLTPREIAGILERAKETLMVRALNRITEAHDVKPEAETPDSRTRALEVQASMDRLTGLFNRASLEDRLKDEFSYAKEHGTSLSVAFIDLDRFKQINDTHGHLVGDEVLQSAARVIAGHLRQTDFIARYGGEEFIVVLPGIGADAARFVSERLLDALRRHEDMSETVKSVRVSASIGLATYAAEREEFSDTTALLRAADRALYAAKNGGRDKTVVYGETS